MTTLQKQDSKGFACSAKEFGLEMIDDYLSEQCHDPIWAFGRLLCQTSVGRVSGRKDKLKP